MTPLVTAIGHGGSVNSPTTAVQESENDLCVQSSSFRSFFWVATLRYGKVQAEAVVGWCNETLEQLSSL
jgi:hypothetical protein